MDFSDTPEEAAFRAEARAWIQANAPKAAVGTHRDEDAIARAKKWQAAKAKDGWACIHWPKEYGGRGASPIERVIFSQEEGELSSLSGVFTIGIGMCAPTLMSWATEEQKREYIPKIANGEHIWCQLFSEPVAGSDLAGIRTRAVKDGDEWVINGQKIWTSGAHISDYAILIVRTDPTVPKHKGLTMFFLSMKSPGIEVRPIKQISGGAEFNEVYFTDVRIPDSQRLGEVGQGWQVSLTTLMSERLAVGSGFPMAFDKLFGLARRVETEDGTAIKNAAIREKFADYYVKTAGLKYTNYRMVSALSRGEVPGPEASISKIVVGTARQDMASLVLDLSDIYGVISDEDLAELDGEFQYHFFRAAANRIEGGSDEILRNIIAERVLGLPPDIRVDKDVPYNEIPTGGKA